MKRVFCSVLVSILLLGSMQIAVCSDGKKNCIVSMVNLSKKFAYFSFKLKDGNATGPLGDQKIKLPAKTCYPSDVLTSLYINNALYFFSESNDGSLFFYESPKRAINDQERFYPDMVKLLGPTKIERLIELVIDKEARLRVQLKIAG